MTLAQPIEDTFAKDRLPSASESPDLSAVTRLDYPDALNVAVALIDVHLSAGRGDAIAILGDGGPLTYAELSAAMCRRANTLQAGGVAKGARVLLRSPNNAELVAWWLAIVRIGAIPVTTAPLLRAVELADVTRLAKPTLAIVDARLAEEWYRLDPQGVETWLVGEGSDGQVAERVAAQCDLNDPSLTQSDDVALIAFTSGSTGGPKATAHFHRDILAIADCYARDVLDPQPDDVFIGSPPLGFTFGLGSLVIFPFRVGAATVMLEAAGPDQLLAAIPQFGATRLFTAPTAYRAMLETVTPKIVETLRSCVSAGEALPASTLLRWRDRTGLNILDGIGSTELLHIFISARPDDVRPGSTGTPVRGYHAMIVDEDMNELPPGTVGRLAVKGPTGCRYLDDPRQAIYVQDGWNVTGDLFVMSPDGHFAFHGRSDDMIISAGYNIGSGEVEQAILIHPSVREVAVVGLADEDRGQVVAAFIVLAAHAEPSEELATAIQNHVKVTIAPFKYPRRVHFVSELPKTPTGKIQRFRLRHEPSV